MFWNAVWMYEWQNLLVLTGLYGEFLLISMLEGANANAVNVSIIIQLPRVSDYQVVWLDSH